MRPPELEYNSIFERFVREEQSQCWQNSLHNAAVNDVELAYMFFPWVDSISWRLGNPYFLTLVSDLNIPFSALTKSCWQSVPQKGVH